MTVLLFVALVLAALGGGLALFTLRILRRVERTLPPAGRLVDTPAARFHVVERGQGPVLLLVHGLAGQLGNFTYGVVDRLAERYRVVAVDRPGSGYSTHAPGASAALSAQADALAALIETLELGRPVVVGHSLGGAVALALAQRRPDCVAGLALVAPLTHLAPVHPVFRGLMIAAPWLRALVAWTVAAPASLILRDAFLRPVFAPEPAPADFGVRGGGLLALRPSCFIGASADLEALPQDLPGIALRYGAMRLPVSILFGRGDRILDAEEQGGALAAALPGATLTLVEGGHMLPVTQPDLTARFIGEAAARAWSVTKAAG